MSRSRAVAIVVVLAFVAFLLWSTLASQRVECAVTVDFRGDTRSATASAASEHDALEQAQTAACGPLTGSMDERIACAKQPPASKQCRTL